MLKLLREIYEISNLSEITSSEDALLVINQMLEKHFEENQLSKSYQLCKLPIPSYKNVEAIILGEHIAVNTSNYFLYILDNFTELEEKCKYFYLNRTCVCTHSQVLEIGKGDYKNFRKIIASTDQFLMLPGIDEKFRNMFDNNCGCGMTHVYLKLNHNNIKFNEYNEVVVELYFEGGILDEISLAVGGDCVLGSK